MKKDQLIRIIMDSQNTGSPAAKPTSCKTTFDKRLDNAASACCPLHGTTADSSEWLLSQIKTAVVDAVNELKTELRLEYEAHLKKVETKFSAEIDGIHSELAALREKFDSTIKDFEREFLHDLRESEQRKDNIMIFGLQESSSSLPSESKEEDIISITTLSSKLGVPNLQIRNCFRLGRRGGRPRPVKVICHNPQQRAELLRCAFRIPRLQTSLGFRRVFIKPDLSPKEQEADRQLREELKQRRESGENVVIRRGRIAAVEPGTVPS